MTPTKRPTIYDADIIDAAAARMIPEITEWLNDDDDDSDCYKESVGPDMLSDLKAAIMYASDGYYIAKMLENKEHWSPNAELVAILEQTYTFKVAALNRAVAEWEKTEAQA